MNARVLASQLSGDRARFVRLARRRLPTEADAEDVVQRAMLRAAERAGSLEDPARLRAWFGRILRRAVADFYRSPRAESPSGPADAEIAVDAPELSDHRCECTVRLLGALRPTYADVLRRVDVEGESPEVAAAALAISDANLHVRLHRARRALRDRIREHCGVTTFRACLDCTCDPHVRCGSP